ncbi:MAG TPA: tetratricopeptide repeat protein [Burkholderiales bacterium]
MLRRLLRQLLGARAASSAELVARGRAERERGELAASLASLEAALRQDAIDAATLAELGLCYRALGRRDEARAAFDRAAASDPGSALALMYLGNLDHESGRLDDAAKAYRAALAIDAKDAAVHYNLALTLMSLGEASAAVESFRLCLAQAPDYADARSSMLFALNMSDRASIEEIAAEHFEWGRRFADPLYSERDFSNSPDPERPLRVGYVSADYFQHAAATFIHAFLARHDPRQCEVFCYVNAAMPADGAGMYGHTWREIRTLDDAQLAALIAQDEIDVLVDLSGHTYGTRLLAFARKPAPVQMTFLGYPNTTGMRAMDYRLTDFYADPPGASESRYREKLLRLPHSVWCFRPRDEGVPDVGALPAIRNGYVSFASLNGVSKLNVELVGLWADLLRRVADARLVLATIAPGSARERILRTFTGKGVDAQRIEFRERLPRDQFLALHNEVDIALDSYPCNGGATTCETLWQGVPVISLAGEAFQSRAGVSLLSSAGLPQLVAHSAADYLDLASSLARNRERLGELRRGLRETLRASPLMDAGAFTRDLEALYRGAWRDWCGERT